MAIAVLSAAIWLLMCMPHIECCERRLGRLGPVFFEMSSDRNFGGEGVLLQLQVPAPD